MAAPDNRIPVTLLTGFLGAGKTTLLNHLIRDPDAGRIAVVVNEFGDVGLDHDLIEEATEETVLLSSGCLCCTVLGDLSEALLALCRRRQNGEIAFDRVVIETSGIADPAPIIHTLASDRQLAQALRLDGVVTLADAATGARTLDAQFEAVQQVAMADVIILSKTDIADALTLGRFKKRLDGINATARRVTANHGQVPTGTLFGLSAMRLGADASEIDTWLGLKAATKRPDPLVGLSGFGAPSVAPKAVATANLAPAAGPRHAGHDHRITSASISVVEAIPAEIFDLWLETLIALKGPNVLRMKGIVHVEGLNHPFVFHAVQHIFDTPVPVKNWSGEDNTSHIVVIARDMHEAELQASLGMLLAKPQDDKNSSFAGGMMVETIEMPF